MFGQSDQDAPEPQSSVPPDQTPKKLSLGQKAGCLVIILVGLALTMLFSKYVSQTLGAIGVIIFMILLIGFITMTIGGGGPRR
jgi:uncharacterized BrkB/YihY/UPF0761 family membrane protein